MSRAMKNSGIPWIGEIPSHWRIEQIGSCIKEVNSPNTDNAEDNALQFKMGTIISKKGGDSKYNPESLEAYNKVRQGDIILNGLNLSFDFISQRVGLVRENGVITSTYLALRPLSLIDSRFLNYLFKGYDYCKALHSMGRGLRATLVFNEFRKYSVIFPSVAEQQTIADFLDKKCGEIDEMISLQDKIIEELKAYKQSVITEAVCKGLNPNVPIKDSEIEWIGEIPSHWGISFITKNLQNLVDYRGKTPEKVVEGVFLVTARNIKDGKIDYEVSKEYVNTEDYDEIMHRGKPEIGDVLFTTEAPLGAVANVDKCYIALAQRIIKFRPNRRILNPYYLKYWIMSIGFQQFLRTLATGSTATGIKGSKLFLLRVLLPPIEEQQAIADYLDEKCNEVDSLIAVKQSKIDSLKEYKKSIIYEFITGKKEIPAL